jgi:hypothetical protein
MMTQLFPQSSCCPRSRLSLQPIPNDDLGAIFHTNYILYTDSIHRKNVVEYFEGVRAKHRILL